MTARRTMNRGADRKTGLAVATLALLLGAPLAQAEETNKRTFHLMDSSMDRTPAKTAFPTYPRIARRDRIEGDATVCFKIDIDGRIRSIRVKNYSHRIFRRPSLRAIKDSSFEPLQPHEILSTSRCQISSPRASNASSRGSPSFTSTGTIAPP